MRFARFAPPGGPPRWGIAEDSALVEVEGDVFGRFGAGSRIWSADEVELLAPVTPSKIVALGTNFSDHAAEMGKPVPAEPKIFLKAPSALVGPGASIVLPQVPGAIEHEAELAVVIGRRARHLRPEQALGCVFGYTCFNDVTARRLQAVDGVFARAKGFDTFAPCGPWIQTGVGWEDLVIKGLVNEQLRQSAPAGQMIFGVPAALAFISRVMTLEPGDLVAMGTPQGVGPLVPGDEVEVRIAGIGSLVNPVVAESLPGGDPCP